MSEKAKISTEKQVDQDRVQIEVELENLTDYITYNYEITITRVDPDFVHQRYTGEFEEINDGNDDYTVTKYWEPEQEGPYTIHSSLIQYESVIATGMATFGWGDVGNNSDAASLVVTPEPLLTHYDIFGNESLEDNVTFHFSTFGTETGAVYES